MDAPTTPQQQWLDVVPDAVPNAGTMKLCPLCRKPFLNELSFSRHTGYCRRARDRPRTRVRSCRACSLAKAKCSFHPQCLRCSRKGIECSYETGLSAVKEPTAAKTSLLSITLSNTKLPSTTPSTASPSFPQDVSGGNNFTLNDLFTSPALVDPNDPQTAVDWGTISQAPDDLFLQSPGNKLPDFTVTDPTVQLMPSTRLLLNNNQNDRNSGKQILANLDQDEFSLAEWATRDDYLVPHTSPPAPSLQIEPGPLARLPVRCPNSRFAGTFIIRMFRAFPEMMLRRETFPSFVHPHWCRDSAEHPLPEPLVNCMVIAQVFASHCPYSKTYLWRAVKVEQQSFIDKQNQGLFSKEELLAAVQASMMYIIMRATDDSKYERDLNMELLHTHSFLCESFRKLLNEPFYQDERLYPSATWEDWIFAESRRRTVLVWFLVAQMFRTKTPGPCPDMDQFRTIPLPAPKALWDAKTRLGWQTEYEVSRFMPGNGLAVLGDLLDAYKQSEGGSDACRLTLDSWTAKADHLGLMLSIGMEMVQA